MARQLANRLGLRFFADKTASPGNLVLVLKEDRLQLEEAGSNVKPLWVDFSSGTISWRLLKGGGRHQSIAKAVGIKQRYRPIILDATAGLGQDAFILASLGCTVQMIERSPVIGALLADGLKRAGQDTAIKPVTERLALRTGVDSIALLREDFEFSPVDVVFLDPMFPDAGRTARSKKEMHFLRLAVGDDPDTDLLLAAALSRAKKRVVVKRPRLAPAIKGPPPSFSRKGRSCRFDIYLV